MTAVKEVKRGHRNSQRPDDAARVRSTAVSADSFAEERDWQQFHTPKNLVMALAGEVGELLEIFQWLTPEQAATIMTDGVSAYSDHGR
jgi:hypothetical protein